MPRSLPHWPAPRRRARQDRHRSAGFALPVAVGASLLLLLSSSSLQLLALQSRIQTAQLQRRHQLEDTLVSAAQQQAAALSASGGCLLTAPLEQWSSAASECGIGSERLQGAQLGQIDGQAYRVTAYTVQAGETAQTTAELELQLDGDRPWRAGFRLQLTAAPQGWRIAAIQALGLRGTQS